VAESSEGAQISGMIVDQDGVFIGDAQLTTEMGDETTKGEEATTEADKA
jgi:hypothetical protein